MISIGKQIHHNLQTVCLAQVKAKGVEAKNNN